MTADDRYIELDVSSLPAAEQFGAWAVILHPFRVRPVTPGAFHAIARAWLLPPLIVSVSDLDGFTVSRTGADIAADGLDALTFQLFLTGGMSGVADGLSFRVDPGDIALQDASLPFEAVVAASRTIAVTMPRSAIEEDVDVTACHGRVLTGSVAAVFAAVMRTLPEGISGLAAEHNDELALLVCRTLSLVLRQMPTRDNPTTLSDRRIRLKARRHIARNLPANLSIAALCEATGASRSVLYRAFRKDGGVAGFVKKRRLYKLRQLLTDGAERRPIATLAALYGFTDASYFNREFRQVFGATPGAVRRGARGEVAPPTEAASTQDTFRDWVVTSEQR